MCVAVLTTGDPQVAELRVQGEQIEHHRAGQGQRHPGKTNKISVLQPKKDMIYTSNSFQQEQQQERSVLLDLASPPPLGYKAGDQ